MIEWGEVYAKEGAQLAPSIAPPVDETSMFAGSLMALPQGVKHGWDVAASTMANASMPVLEKVTPDSMTAWLEDQRRVANESMKATRTDPRTMGTVGQLIHGVSSILTMGVAGAPLGPVGAAGAIGGLSMFDKSTELIEQGVDLQTAQKVGAVTGTVMGVGAALPPFIGGTLTKQIASGIGINVGLGMTERAASGEILEDKYAGIAQHYKALDGMAIAIDAVLGAAFPIGARLIKRPSVAQIDDAQDANRVVAEQSRDPALQATLEGIERHREIADDVTRQILEENRPLGDIEIPANAMDDVVPNEQFGQAASIAAKAIDDLMIQESGTGVGKAEADISTLAKAAAPSPDTFMLTGSNRAADVGAAAGQTSIFDASPDQFTKQAARGIIESDPTMTVMDENGNSVAAKDLLDQAETKFQQETKEADLFKVAVACAIGVGE